MMNRRSFLQVLGLGVVGSTVIGKIIQSIPEKSSVPEFELILESQSVVAESQPVVAKTRKLNAQYTIECAQDLEAFHSVEAESELLKIIQSRDYIA